ncbi:anti-sigma factor family protein [Azospirillum brasilense]|uniref:Anti-sigma factor RsiW n=1 Tax=Azospirillum brasilense TaxID=192 RepID=A0A235H971_AZOBR|nr:anti-sigma factor [Azospirillum brasilense]OYD82359.1 hypothetical protein CHT98_20595 [Azospirillum brasilense]
MATPVTEDDLLAYVDDQLPPERRIEVEAYLQGNPALASRVMQDLRQRDKLRLYLMDDPTGAEALEPARAVSAEAPPSALSDRSAARRFPKLRRALAAVILIGVGWTAHTLLGDVLVDPVAAAHPIPVFADEAVEAHRAAMTIGPSFSGLPPDEAPRLAQVVSRVIGGHLPLPRFPADLQPLASRIVPWDEGSAVQVVYMTPAFERVTLFAAEDKTFTVTTPTAAELHGVSVVYWRHGHHVYALCASVPAERLLDLADAVQTSWF